VNDTDDRYPYAPRLAYSVDEAAHAISISRTELYRMVKRGDLRARRCGQRILISRRELERYLEEQQ